jgi:hypothetical protein
MSDETVTVTLTTDRNSDEIDVPVVIADLLAEDGESVTTVAGDLAMLGFAQQAHGIVHHSQGDVGEDLEAAEQLTLDLFEERFGQSYAEVTGHSH